MRSKLRLLAVIMLGFILVNTGCKKADSDTPTPTPTPVEKYDVMYSLNFNKASYENLKVSYMNVEQALIDADNPSDNWEINLSDFKTGDSLILNMEFLSIPVDTLYYTIICSYKITTASQYTTYVTTDTTINLQGGHIIKGNCMGTIE
jgi:ribosomal protein S10